MRVGGRAAVATCQDLAVGEQAVGHQRSGARNVRCHEVDGGELELRAVREMRPDAMCRVHRPEL